MAQEIRPGVGGVLKTVNKVCAGVGGVVKEVDAGYGSIGGVRKQFYSGKLMLYDNGTFYNGFNVHDEGNHTGEQYIKNSTSLLHQGHDLTENTHLLATYDKSINWDDYSKLHVKFKVEAWAGNLAYGSGSDYDSFSPLIRLLVDGSWKNCPGIVDSDEFTVKVGSTYNVDMELSHTVNNQYTYTKGDGLRIEWYLDWKERSYTANTGRFTIYEIWLE